MPQPTTILAFPIWNQGFIDHGSILIIFGKMLSLLISENEFLKNCFTPVLLMKMSEYFPYKVDHSVNLVLVCIALEAKVELTDA